MGHSGSISDLTFAPSSISSSSKDKSNLIISSSYDGLVKVWNLQEQCCVQTIANHGGQVLCSTIMDLDAQEKHNSSKTAAEENESSQHPYRCRLVTGCIDGKVRIYNVSTVKKPHRIAQDDVILEADANDTHDVSRTVKLESDVDDVCFFMGTLIPPPNVATSNEKISNVQFHPSGKYFAYLRSNSKTIDLYAVRTREESIQKAKRRLRRKREKENKSSRIQSNRDSNDTKVPKRGILDDDDDDYGNHHETNQTEESGELIFERNVTDDEEFKASDEFEYITTLRATHKVKAFEFAPYIEKKGNVRIICGLSTNELEVHLVTKTAADGDQSQPQIIYLSNIISTIDMYGHPTGIRSISLSSDDNLACTVSKNSAKVWNVMNRSCIRSLTLNSSNNQKEILGRYGLCSVFLPGNSHIVIGTKEGYLLIIDIASGDVVFSNKAHEKEIWSIDMKKISADGDESIAIITGSADRNVKFWDIETQTKDDLNDLEIGSVGHPMLAHTRTLLTTDDVIAVRYSYSSDRNKRMVFVATLDSQIKVFFEDSLKFFLSLYGHTLPALAIDSSDDDAILASGGADKSIKIWGLDFGDTHRTLYGHTDSITDLKFVRKTHNFFTGSKDGTIRYWDGDRYNQILLLDGHISEVNSLVVAKTGAFVLSAGMDRQVRAWERTKDMVFIEEEREREMEALYDKVDNTDEYGTEMVMRRKRDQDETEEDDHLTSGGPQSEAAVKRSVLSVSSGDRIMEAIERADQELKESNTFLKSQVDKGKAVQERSANPLLMGMKPADYILWVLQTIKSAELEQSLIILPLNHMERLIFYLVTLLREGRGIELCSRTAIFLIKTHQNQLIGYSRMSTPLRELRRLIKVRLTEARDNIGYNLAAIRSIRKSTNEFNSRYKTGSDAEIVTKPVFTSKVLGLGSSESEILQRKRN